MCLQWCHVRRWLINNDQLCEGCELQRVAELPAAWSCASCTHRVMRSDEADRCGLTGAGLPLAGRCCHWCVPLSTPAPAEPQGAPWLGACNHDAMSVPLVYGVPAAGWEEALGIDSVRELEACAPPLDPLRRNTILATLALLDAPSADIGAVMAQLRASLGPPGLAGLPPVWQAIVIELMQEYYHP